MTCYPRWVIATHLSVAPMPFAALIRCRAWSLLLGLGLLVAAPLHAEPLKVFIFAGQSNMEGQARIKTFDYLADDPETAPLLRKRRGPDGTPASCDGAWISHLTGDDDGNFELSGRLTAGFGSLWGLDRTQPGDKIGPEFTFGLTLDAAFPEPVLLIKVAWGMAEEEKREFMTQYEAERITPEDLALWKRGASNAGYHYLGCAKTFARMGQAFAEANLRLLEARSPK